MQVAELLKSIFPNAKTIEIKDGRVLVDGVENWLISVKTKND